MILQVTMMKFAWLNNIICYCWCGLRLKGDLCVKILKMKGCSQLVWWCCGKRQGEEADVWSSIQYSLHFTMWVLKGIFFSYKLSCRRRLLLTIMQSIASKNAWGMRVLIIIIVLFIFTQKIHHCVRQTNLFFISWCPLL